MERRARMPIIGITDSVRPSLPSIGKLRKGGAKPEGGMGKDLEWFRFTSSRPEVVQAFIEAYGEKPVLINCFLPYTAWDMNFSTWREEWKGSRLAHRCDGETMMIWLEADGKYRRGAKPCPYAHTDEEKRACAPVGRLNVIIPELVQRGFAGYVTMETHSINDIMAITATLLDVLDQRQGNVNGLRGIPFVLKRGPAKINAPIGGKRAQVTKWLVTLEPAATWLGLHLTGQEQEVEKPVVDGAEPGQREYDVDAETGEVTESGEDGIGEDDLPFDEDPEPARWQDSEDMQVAFRTAVKVLGLKNAEVFAALGNVQTVSAYGGTYEEAIAALKKYKAEKGASDAAK
jgi:hypothetical protein